jgi:hypothetical protein
MASENEIVSFAGLPVQNRCPVLILRGATVAPLTLTGDALKLSAAVTFPALMTSSNPEHLPHVLRLLIEAAGEEAAMTIALHRGGSRMTIPQKAAGSTLEKLVGEEAAAAIVKVLARERLNIPLSTRLLNGWLKSQGLSQERRAMALKVSRRSIQYWDSGSTPSRSVAVARACQL